MDNIGSSRLVYNMLLALVPLVVVGIVYYRRQLYIWGRNVNTATCLFSSINLPSRVVTVRSTADQKGSIALHKAKRKPLEEVATSLSQVIFGYFIEFGHFPIEIPIEVQKNYGQRKEWSYNENKKCSEICEQNGTT